MGGAGAGAIVRHCVRFGWRGFVRLGMRQAGRSGGWCEPERRVFASRPFRYRVRRAAGSADDWVCVCGPLSRLPNNSPAIEVGCGCGASPFFGSGAACGTLAITTGWLVGGACGVTAVAHRRIWTCAATRWAPSCCRRPDRLGPYRRCRAWTRTPGSYRRRRRCALV